MTKARDIATLLSTSNGKIAGNNLDVSFENISDTGTEGTKVASGTTAQRGTTAGQFRFNSTSGKFEGYDGTTFKTIENAPAVSSISPTNLESSALPANLTITGENFQSGDTVKFIGADLTEISSPTVTVDSSTQITASVPATVTSANEPFQVRVTNSGGLFSTLSNAFNIDAAPAFSVASGSLGTLADVDRAASNLTAITATDDEGDSITFSITTGSVPAGLTFNSDGTWSGTATAVASDTTSTFTVTASDGTNTTTRQYSIKVDAPIATGGTTSSYQDGSTTYIVHTFTTNSNFVLNTAKSVDYLIVGGGGGGGNSTTGGGDGAGGGGAGGYYYTTGVSLSAGTYSAVIGSGGSPNGGGTTSSFNSITAGGGGNGGADESGGGSGQNATAGGSGGGTGCRTDSPGSAGSGGTARSSGGGTYANDAGAGGGGAVGQGGNTRGGNNGGHGGQGQTNSITGTSVMYANGGGGGIQSGTDAGNGSDGNNSVTSPSRGGYGSGIANRTPVAPVANTGSGGGGAGFNENGASGADGVVIIRYAA
jgi:hypothetical protein